jgi:hypothetical protein
MGYQADVLQKIGQMWKNYQKWVQIRWKDWKTINNIAFILIWYGFWIIYNYQAGQPYKKIITLHWNFSVFATSLDPIFTIFWNLFYFLAQPPGNLFIQFIFLIIKLSLMHENPVRLHHIFKNIICPIYGRSSWSPFSTFFSTCPIFNGHLFSRIIF